MAKLSELRADIIKSLKVDGRTREGRRLKVQAQEAKALINGTQLQWQWRPLIPLPPGLYHVDGREITQDDIMRADFNEWLYIAPRRRHGGVTITHQEPIGDERTQVILDTLGSS